MSKKTNNVLLTEPVDLELQVDPEILGDDWGIVFDDPPPVKREEELEEALRRLYSVVEPLIDNLCRRPETETIRWPNRKPVLDKLKTDLQEILSSVGLEPRKS